MKNIKWFSGLPENRRGKRRSSGGRERRRRICKRSWIDRWRNRDLERKDNGRSRLRRGSCDWTGNLPRDSVELRRVWIWIGGYRCPMADARKVISGAPCRRSWLPIAESSAAGEASFGTPGVDPEGPCRSAGPRFGSLRRSRCSRLAPLVWGYWMVVVVMKKGATFCNGNGCLRSGPFWIPR